MSYTTKYHDYVRDVPMDIGHRFFPLPSIALPAIPLPPPPRTSQQYTFEVERKARRQFDEDNEKKAAAVTAAAAQAETAANTGGERITQNGHATIASSSSSSVTEVLMPSRAAPPVAAVPLTSSVSQPQLVPFKYEEFEDNGNVFDDLAIRSIDDRAALSQILGSCSIASKQSVHAEEAKTAPAAMQQTMSAPATATSAPATGAVNTNQLPSYPTLSFGAENGTGKKNGTVSYHVGNPKESVNPTVTTSVNTAPAKATPKASGLSLRERLLNKGYKEHLVDICLARLPRERHVHIEYYMNGMRMLEKLSVKPDATLTFLMDCNLTDKQAVLDTARTAEQLVTMGFTGDMVFPSLLATKGDRVAALEKMLAA